MEARKDGEAVRLTQSNDPAVVFPRLYVEGNKTCTVQDDADNAEEHDEPGRSSFIWTLMYGFQSEFLIHRDKCNGVHAELGREGVRFLQSLHQQRKLPGTLSMFSNGCFDNAVSMNLGIR